MKLERTCLQCKGELGKFNKHFCRDKCGWQWAENTEVLKRTVFCRVHGWVSNYGTRKPRCLLDECGKVR